MRLKLKTLLVLSAVLTISCATEKKNIRVYSGDHQSASISRFQEGEVISCTNPVFSRMMCLDSEDFYRLVDTAENCNGL